MTGVQTCALPISNLINSDPYGDGWIMEIEVSDLASVADLLDAASYRLFIEG